MFNRTILLNNSDTPNTLVKYSLFFALLLLILIQTKLYFINNEAIAHKVLPFDGDGYWHLLRAENIYNSSSWYDLSLSRSNAPYGETIHWTKSFDILLLSGALFLSNFIVFKEALYWWGVFINPILQILSLLLLVYSTRNIFRQHNSNSVLIAYLLPFQLSTTFQFGIGRPDHHGFLLFLFVLLFAVTLTVIYQNSNKLYSIIWGAIAAFSIWTGIESLVPVLITFLFFGFTWVFLKSNWVHTNLYITLSTLLFSIVLLMIDIPLSDLLNPEYDRISIVHLTLFSFVSFFWIIVVCLEYKKFFVDNLSKRLLISFIGFSSSTAMLYFYYPLFFEGPTVGIDPLIKAIYFSRAGEFLPIFSNFDQITNGLFLGWLLTLSSLILCIYILFRINENHTLFWGFIVALSLAYIILSMYQKRWLSYAQLISTIPFSFLIHSILRWINLNFNKLIGMTMRVFVIFTFCSLPVLLFNVPNSSLPSYNLLQNHTIINELCNFLNNDKTFRNKPSRILASIYLGPYLLYKTNHEVIGTPAHRNISGIKDTFTVMTADNEETALNVIRNRNISHVLIGRPKNGFDDNFGYSKENSMFYYRLWEGDLPPWLKSITVPSNLKDKVKCFKVMI